MHTKVIKIDREQIDASVISEAGQILKEGGLVAFPTETVYGLGANALDEEAAAKVYAAKGRPSDNPLIVHIADMESLAGIARQVPEAAHKLAEAFWPGPLTMIFPKKEAVPCGTTGGLATVAVRMPSDEIARAVIRSGGGYIAAPSANTSGRPSPTLAAHVKEDMDGKIPLILDGGPVQIGLESTIVDLTEEIPVILRPGYITLEMIKGVLGEAKMDQGLLSEDPLVHPRAPGMKYRHYAPRADLKVVEGPAKDVVAYINRRAADQKTGIICTEETRHCYTCGMIKCVGTRTDERSVAEHLYEVLRAFDEEGVEAIYSESFDSPGLGQAIMNRLLKAAGHQRIDASKEKP